MKPALIAATFIVIVACTDNNPKQSLEADPELGTLVFTANGEDFVRRGFIDKNGWRIDFDNLFVNIVDSTAYSPGKAVPDAMLEGPFFVDLAEGDEYADPVTVGRVEKVEAGNYQSLRFELKRALSGRFRGSSIVMIGRASKADRTVEFILKLDEELVFDGKDGYVGDEVKGLLKVGESISVEMTFHFDHIFGDREAGAEGHINTGAVGFDFFNRYTENGRVSVTQSELTGDEEYPTFVRAIWTLGHLGEGHCDVSGQSSRGEI